MVTWGNISIYNVPKKCASRYRESYKTNCDRCNLLDYYMFFEYTNNQALCWICTKVKNKYDKIMIELLKN